MAQITNEEKASPDSFNESKVSSILRKAVVQRVRQGLSYISSPWHTTSHTRLTTSISLPQEDSAKQYLTHDRPDLAETEHKERDFLAKYLPTQLSEAQIDDHLHEVLAKGGLGTPTPNVGQVLKAFFATVDRSAVDGQLVSARAKALIAGS